MRDLFPGYYDPTPSDFKKLWDVGTFVLDTNVLLDLYRYPEETREQLFSALESLGDRIWVPFHVALEFQRNRGAVIAEEKARLIKMLARLATHKKEVEVDLATLKFDKRNLGVDPQKLLKPLVAAYESLSTAIEKAQQTIVKDPHGDPIRDRIDLLLSGRVGAAPASQDELDALVGDAEYRYAQCVPPGYKDSNKGDFGFVHGSIRYKAAYGDLILWRQLLAHVSKDNIQFVAFVSADKKEDWWCRDDSHTSRPWPELTDEIARDGKVEVFCMYTTDRFLKYAKDYLSIAVADQSLEDIRNVAKRLELELSTPEANGGIQITGFGVATTIDHSPTFTAKNRVLHWLKTQLREGHRIVERIGFQDFVVYGKGMRHGVRVELVSTPDPLSICVSAEAALAQGSLEMLRRKVDTFSLVIIVSDDMANGIASVGGMDLLQQLISLLQKYRGWTLVIGYQYVNGFVPVRTIDQDGDRHKDQGFLDPPRTQSPRR